MSDSPIDSPYDSQLPFLEALEHEVRREAERVIRQPAERARRRSHDEAVASPAPSEHAARTRRPLPAPSLRIARRSLALVGLLCLIGATAYGASAVLSTRSTNPLTPTLGAFVPAAHGNAGSERWSLRLYIRGGELCRVLVVGETLSSRCEIAPQAGAVQMTSIDSPLHRYVFGVAGRKVSSVLLRVGRAKQTIATHKLDQSTARAAGLPRDVRYYLAVLQRPLGGANPAESVRPLVTNGAGTAQRRRIRRRR